MPKLLIKEPVAALLRHLEDCPGRSLIALAGLPGSGKSTLAARLSDEVNAQLGPGAMAALSMDGFHFTRAQLDKFEDPITAHIRRGSPPTFDAAGMAANLAQLKPGYSQQAVAWPGFEHGVGDPVPGPPVPPETRLILVEGLYLLMNRAGWENVSSQFDELWFLDTSRELALSRLTARHRATYGITEEEALARIARNDGINAEIVWGTRGNADAWISDEIR